MKNFSLIKLLTKSELNRKKKDQFVRFKLYMVTVIGVNLGIIIFILFWGYINSINVSTNPLQINLVYTFLLLLVFITFFFFLRKIYIPITKFEKVIKRVEMGQVDIQYDMEDKDVSPLLNSLNTMLLTMKDSLDREYLAQILKKQAEINALQSQITPHFLYNTLDSIRGEALLNDMEEIADMIEALSTFFRYNISQQGNMVSLREEIKNVENYLLIQQFRFNNKFTFSKMIDDEDQDILNYKIPKLTLQPIVENAIQHGLETKIGKGNVTLRVYQTAKRLVILVSDNGVGMPKEKMEKLNTFLDSGNNLNLDEEKNQGNQQNGIALKNVNERIQLYFGDKYGLFFSSTAEVGTEVEMIIPLVLDDTSGIES